MAGTATEQPLRQGPPASAHKGIQGVPVNLIADAIDASFPVHELFPMAGAAVAVGVVFDAMTPPDVVSIALPDIDGLDLLGGSGAAISSSRRLPISPLAPFTPGLTVALTGNSIPGAKILIVLYVI